VRRIRHEYVLDLTKVDPRTLAARHIDAVEVRPASASDATALAVLMLDAYRGTIDYEGETPEQTRREVERFYLEEPLLDASAVAVFEGALSSAVLMRVWRGHPLVRTIMTAPAQKRRGLAELVLAHALAKLAAQGHREAHAFITEGNTPSEATFARLGFQRVERTR
jgi:L-amino acid N-acyltransferase YncA